MGFPERKRCIYCGQFNRPSHEHLIADWVKNVVKRNDTHQLVATQISRSTSETTLTSPFVKEKQGDLGTRTIRKVCLPCNTGWMKNIQDRAIPVLSPLFSGVWGNLDADKSRLIALWVCMTVMNFDAADFDGSGIPAHELRYLRMNQTPPPNWALWIGKRTGGTGLAAYHRPFKIHRTGLPIPNDQVRNSQVTTIELGQMVAHAVSTPPGMLVVDALAYGRELGVIPVFPEWGGNDLDWRYGPFLTTQDVSTLANALILRLLQNPL